MVLTKFKEDSSRCLMESRSCALSDTASTASLGMEPSKYASKNCRMRGGDGASPKTCRPSENSRFSRSCSYQEGEPHLQAPG